MIYILRGNKIIMIKKEKRKNIYLLELVVLILCLSACSVRTNKDDSYVESLDSTTDALKEDDFVNTESITSFPPSIEEETEKEPSYYGVWEITSYQSEGITGHTLDEANTFLGMNITYQADAVLQNEQKVNIENIVYKDEESPYTEELFRETYNINLGEWWSGVESISRITINTKEKFLGDCFFIVDSETIWIYYKDVVYLAKKK